MSIKYEIEKEKLEEIRQERSKTNNKKEDRRLYVIELRILGYTNEEIVKKIDVKPKNNTKVDKIIYIKRSTRNTKQKKTR